jgi:hypothetical protein
MADPKEEPTQVEEQVEYFDFSPTEVGDPEPVTEEDPEPKKGSPEFPPIQDPRNDPSRMEYWQSVADKRQKRLQELEPLAPIGKLFEEDPELIPELEKIIAQRRQPKGPLRPEPPAMPAVFDEAESFTNPESESWKFRKSKDAFQTKLLDFYDQREAARQAQLEEEGRRKQAEDKMRQDEAKLRIELVAKGVPEAEIPEFISTFSKPGGVKLDHLVELFNTIKSKGKSIDKKTKDLQRRNERLEVPPPITEGGETEATEEDDPQANFNQSLLAYKRK